MSCSEIIRLRLRCYGHVAFLSKVTSRDEVELMETMSDVLQQLKKYGTIIYTKDRLLDLSLMEEEWRELHKWKMVEQDVFQKGLLILRAERRREEEKRSQ